MSRREAKYADVENIFVVKGVDVLRLMAVVPSLNEMVNLFLVQSFQQQHHSKYRADKTAAFYRELAEARARRLVSVDVLVVKTQKCDMSRQSTERFCLQSEQCQKFISSVGLQIDTIGDSLEHVFAKIKSSRSTFSLRAAQSLEDYRTICTPKFDS